MYHQHKFSVCQSTKKKLPVNLSLASHRTFNGVANYDCTSYEETDKTSKCVIASLILAVIVRHMNFPMPSSMVDEWIGVTNQQAEMINLT